MHISGIVGFHYMQTKSSSPLATDTQIQQGFIDERAPLNPTAVDPSRTEDDERGDEMSEPSQKTRTEKRNDFQMDETSKELRAPLPFADPSHKSLLRPSDETLEQPERSSKQARTAKKGSEALQDVSYLFQKKHCKNQRNEFLQVRMAGMRKSNKKKC